MKLLLDTHAFLWCDGDAERLPGTLVETLRDPAHDLILSVISVWEMQIKAALGRLVLRTPLARLIEGQQARNGLQMLPVSLEHVLALDALEDHHRAHQAEQRELMESDWHDTGLVFSTSLGTPIHPRNALRSFKRQIAPLDITQIRLHDLRHTHASLALQRGVPAEVVSERLGHARVDITLNTYRHLYESERQGAALSLYQLLSGTPRTIN